MRTLLIAAAMLTATSAGAVTIVNGSFEDGVAIANGGFVTLSTGDTTITGWTVLSDGVDYIGTYWQASTGTRSLDLSAVTSGGVSQMLDGFVVGKRYRLTFDVSANPDGGNDTKTLLVSATGGLPVTYDYVRTAANTRANMLWTTLSYDFVASGTMQSVQFRSQEFNPSGIALDNVAISLVPEPAAWAMLIAGFAMTGAALRGRRALRSVIA